MESQILFISILATNTLLAVVLLAIGFSYAKTVRRLSDAEKERDALNQQMQEKTTAVLDEARSRAIRIIQEANVKAQSIISSSAELDEQSKQTLATKLQELSNEESERFGKSSEDISKMYETMLQKLREEHINLLQNMAKDIEKQAISEIDEFKSLLEKDTVGTQKELQERIDREYLAIRDELAKYKAARMKKIDDTIYQVLQTVALEIIGKSINLEDQQKLVTDALTSAKNDLAVLLQLDTKDQSPADAVKPTASAPEKQYD